MVVQTDVRPASARFRTIGKVSDRTKAFRAAKRHSALVKLLRLFLPIATLSIAGLYLVPSNPSVTVKGGEASVEKFDVTNGALKMVNPRIKGVHEKHGVYDIQADYATQQADNTELIALETIDAKLTSKEGKLTTLKAPSGIYQSKKEELTFDNGVTIGGDAGFAGQLKSATAFFKSDKLISTEPVELVFRSTTVKARSMTYYSAEARAIFEGGVRVHLEREAGDAEK